MTVQPIDDVALVTAGLDEDFDLDIRVAVGADVALPEAGFSCSWFTCQATCACSVEHCLPKTWAQC
ncbi:hypothetical protein [Nonomuraea sp. NPDC049709]|uniref:hypothetical protein n=1 Tax=Nonomuraea sp. NPDC049709 TaxID=3154736 RepID=UPI003416D8EF